MKLNSVQRQVYNTVYVLSKERTSDRVWNQVWHSVRDQVWQLIYRRIWTHIERQLWIRSEEHET